MRSPSIRALLDPSNAGTAAAETVVARATYDWTNRRQNAARMKKPCPWPDKPVQRVLRRAHPWRSTPLAVKTTNFSTSRSEVTVAPPFGRRLRLRKRRRPPRAVQRQADSLQALHLLCTSRRRSSRPRRAAASICQRTLCQCRRCASTRSTIDAPRGTAPAGDEAFAHRRRCSHPCARAYLRQRTTGFDATPISAERRESRSVAQVPTAVQRNVPGRRRQRRRQFARATAAGGHAVKARSKPRRSNAFLAWSASTWLRGTTELANLAMSSHIILPAARPSSSEKSERSSLSNPAGASGLAPRACLPPRHRRPHSILR